MLGSGVRARIRAFRYERACIGPWRILGRVHKIELTYTLGRDAAQPALRARVDGLPDDFLPAALWRDGTLVKTWAMRGTLHLLVRDDLPTYVGALAAARAAALVPVPVPTDAGGLRPDLLASAFAASGARLLYTQPTHANPTGASLAADRRAAVLTAARDAGAFVLEDDWARHLHLDPQRPAPAPLWAEDRDGRVVHLSSLAKAAAPSLRIGALTARGPAAARLASARLLDDFGPSRVLQETAVDLLGSPAWPRHLARLHAALRERRDALAAAVAQHLPDAELTARPRGGLHLWLRLPTGTDDRALAERAAAGGVVVGAGSPYFVTEAPAPHLRLSYAGADAATLAAGAERLARVRAASSPGAGPPVAS